jgi:membrane protein YdbS with pleckstrin-like domain
MNCPHCAKEVASDTVFCGHCGGKLDGEQVPTPPLVEPRRHGPPPLTENDPRTQFVAAVDEKQAAAAAHSEDEVWSGSYSKKAMLGFWIGGSVLSVALPIAAAMLGLGSAGWTWLMIAILLMWVLLIGGYFYRRLGVHYTLTTQRFLHETGLLWRRTDRIELIDIDDVTFKQGPIERMMKIGTIHIVSSDKTDPEIDLPGIDDVKRVAGLIDDLRRQERRRRGLHITST